MYSGAKTSPARQQPREIFEWVRSHLWMAKKLKLWAWLSTTQDGYSNSVKDRRTRRFLKIIRIIKPTKSSAAPQASNLAPLQMTRSAGSFRKIQKSSEWSLKFLLTCVRWTLSPSLQCSCASEKSVAMSRNLSCLASRKNCQSYWLRVGFRSTPWISSPQTQPQTGKVRMRTNSSPWKTSCQQNRTARQLWRLNIWNVCNQALKTRKMMNSTMPRTIQSNKVNLKSQRKRIL